LSIFYCNACRNDLNFIYKNASHVLVWLGPDDEAVAEPAFKLIRNLDEIFQDEERREKFRIDHTDHLKERSKEPWVPLTRVTHLPWVSRAEAILSPRNTNAFADIYIAYSSSPARR
jgi:Heterokaryon incompatibility protein (HET)